MRRASVVGGALLLTFGLGILLGNPIAWALIGLGAGLILQGFVPRG